jgi:LysM repeat protein
MFLLFRFIDAVTFLLQCSRYRISSSDNQKVGTMKYLVILFFFAFHVELFANPFARFNEDIEKTVVSSSGQVFKIFGSQDSEIQKLFSQGVNTQGDEEDAQVASLDLPKYLDISPVVSNVVIHESGVILKKYTVQKKDTLTKIAKSFATDIAKLKKHNSLTSNSLKLGQVLEIPVQIKNASSSRVIKKKMFILPVPQSRITSRFGRRVDPFNKYNRVYHTGLDLAAKVGTPVVSAAEGEVIFTGRNGGYGNSVIIQHKNGYKTVYAHCSQILVEVGETVKMGRVIAAVGRTGTATGAHLHFEVFLNGKLMNPETALNITEKFVTKLPKSEFAGI